MEILNEKILSFLFDRIEFFCDRYDDFNFDNVDYKFILALNVNLDDDELDTDKSYIVEYMNDDEKLIINDLRKEIYEFLIANRYNNISNDYFDILMRKGDKALNDELLNDYTYYYCIVNQNKLIQEIKQYADNKVLLK